MAYDHGRFVWFECVTNDVRTRRRIVIKGDSLRYTKWMATRTTPGARDVAASRYRATTRVVKAIVWLNSTSEGSR